MILTMVRNQIESSLAAPRARERFLTRINDLARSQDVALMDEELEAFAILGERYVRSAYRLFENCDIAGHQCRAEAVFDPLLGAASQFFLNPPAIAPEREGLFGMACSAYAARSVLEVASERMRMVRGFTLFAAHPHSEAPIMRTLLGADLADQLRDLAEAAHDSPQTRFYANNVYLLTGPVRASARVSEWGGSWEDDAASIAAAVGIRLDARPSTAPAADRMQVFN